MFEDDLFEVPVIVVVEFQPGGIKNVASRSMVRSDPKVDSARTVNAPNRVAPNAHMHEFTPTCYQICTCLDQSHCHMCNVFMRYVKGAKYM